MHDTACAVDFRLRATAAQGRLARNPHLSVRQHGRTAELCSDANGGCMRYTLAFGSGTCASMCVPYNFRATKCPFKHPIATSHPIAQRQLRIPICGNFASPIRSHATPHRPGLARRASRLLTLAIHYKCRIAKPMSSWQPASRDGDHPSLARRAPLTEPGARPYCETRTACLPACGASRRGCAMIQIAR